MSKIQKTNKEAKKQPAKTMKEKRALKEIKRHAKDAGQPFVVHKD